MTWEWSHTQDAYDNALKNLSELPYTDLFIILAEWKAWPGYRTNGWPPTGFDEKRYEEAKTELSREFGDINVTAGSIASGWVDTIWRNAKELRNCDNGGFNAWVCPYGCHTVSFDRE